MDQYTITGMSCAACSARIEKAVSKVPGVTACSVSLLTNSMGVEGSASTADIIAAVTGAGYGASSRDTAHSQTDTSAQESLLEDRETPVIRRRLFSSLLFLLVLMYISMGHMMWGWPLPTFFDGNHTAMGLFQLLLAVIIMVINQKFFISGFKSLIHRAPNMDTLVAMGSFSALAYSVYALFAMTDAQLHGGAEAAKAWMHEFYFESAAMIVTLITVGKLLEAISKGRTTDALKGLMKLAPKTAVLIVDGKEQEVPVEKIQPGDIFAVKPGEHIPVDGVVTDGRSAVNESALTGESIPVDKEPGSIVSAATLNQSGYITCRATRVGQDTTLSQIIRMVSDAAATKAPIAKVADTVSGIFVPAVIIIALITIAAWLLAGQTFGYALARGISVLVISCPCALGLATPVAIMVGNGVGAKHGILFKTAESLEKTGRTTIVALDKTGTITTGSPTVTDIIPASSVSEMELLQAALNLEAKSEHPLAKAVLAKAESVGLKPEPVTDFTVLPGNGLTASASDGRITGGSIAYISESVPLPPQLEQAAQELAQSGKTPLCFAKNNTLLGIIAVADTIKADSPAAVKALQAMGIRVVMLTGDNERTAKAIGSQAGVDEVIAGVLPDGKEAVIRRLKSQGQVTMVGDGINDAPALTRADTGIAIGAGTDIAIDAADVVLMNSRLSDVPAAIRLSRATLRNIHENLFWAFFYNVIGIPLAAGAYIHAFGWTLNPMFGAAAMSLSSFCVVTNALRLNLLDISRPSRGGRKNGRISTRATDSTIHAAAGTAAAKTIQTTVNLTTEEKHMTEKTVKIQGMMCGHCEARVKKALEAVPGIAEAVPDHNTGTALIKMSAPVDDAAIRQAVEAQDYTYLG